MKRILAAIIAATFMLGVMGAAVADKQKAPDKKAVKVVKKGKKKGAKKAAAKRLVPQKPTMKAAAPGAPK